MSRTGHFTRACETCGLAVAETTTGWHHLGTWAGRKAETDHKAQPKRLDARKGRAGGTMSDRDGASVSEIRGGASRQAPVAEAVARATCRRPHKDADPCYDIEVPVMVDNPRWSMPRESKTETETVHIPGCMGCAVYGHDRCHCPSVEQEGR